MGNGFSDAALAIFTTLAPMGACAFIVLATAFASQTIEDEEAKKIDRMTLIPLLLLLAGFIGATFHLASPQNALSAVFGIGRSPLTNEVMVGGLFFVAALVYWIMALRGALGQKTRKVFLIILAAWAVVFTLFCGFAYLMNTIPTWDTPWTVIQMLGYGLLGGSLAGSLTLKAAGIEQGSSLATTALIQAVVGLACGLIGFGEQIIVAGGMTNIWVRPSIWSLLFGGSSCSSQLVEQSEFSESFSSAAEKRLREALQHCASSLL